MDLQSYTHPLLPASRRALHSANVHRRHHRLGAPHVVAARPRPLGLEPPPALLEAIADAPAGPIASICVMNVAMSAATECGHLRNGDADAAAGSALTNKRAVSLVRALVQGQESGPHVGRPSFGAVEQSLMELKQAVDMRLKKDDMFSDDYMNSWTSILEMWKYDEEQEQAVAAAIERCRGAEEDSAGMARGDFVGLSAQRGT